MIIGGHVFLLFIPLLVIGLVVWAVVAIVRSSEGRRTAAVVADRRECPACKELIRRDATICPHCRTASEPWTFSDGRWWVARADGRWYLDARDGTWKRLDPLPPPV
jgi:hypothetical protein